MSNEILWLIFAAVNFIIFLTTYKLFGKMGIFIWIVFATIVANIQVLTNINLFGLKATLGNIVYGTIFLGTDVLTEIYGKKEAKKAVFIGFGVMSAYYIIMQLAISFTPNEADWAMPHLRSLLEIVPQILLGSALAFIVSQLIDVQIFSKLKEKLPETKWLWVRNNGSTLLSQLIDTVIFVPIAFYGVYNSSIIFEIIITTYVVKLLVALLDTPIIYLAKKIHPLQE
jgi:hypothetical protein